MSKLPSTTRSLPMALMRARERVMAPIREMLSESGITEQQWRVLRVLAEFGPLDASEVADKASLLQPSLTRMARSMADRGLISQRTDPDDRRRQILAMEPGGQYILDANTARAAEIAEGYRAHLGAERYDALLDALEDLARDQDGA